MASASLLHVDNHKPCPVCGKPFETESLRDTKRNLLERHIAEKRDEAHKRYREIREISLHAIYCDCERCTEIRKKRRAE